VELAFYDGRTHAEVAALQARADQALLNAAPGAPVQAFRDQVATHSRAIVNVDVGFLHSFFVQKRGLYNTYQQQVAAQSRSPAAFENDRRRTAVESLLFGSYGGKLVYAALSLDGGGLPSYGGCALQLAEAAIERRSSLLEENSFFFVDRHGVSPTKTAPPGYQATWPRRGELAQAKLAPRLKARTTAAEFPAILLKSEGERATDDFLEVYIYGVFDHTAVEAIKVEKSPTEPADRLLLQACAEQAEKVEIPWKD
ncbi:MAG TPA: hypothetical protein PKY30_15215, partial [Myxococcota bacterium]|nr:hypothetical protein [Myxococcota bacterium]